MEAVPIAAQDIVESINKQTRKKQTNDQTNEQANTKEARLQLESLVFIFETRSSIEVLTVHCRRMCGLRAEFWKSCERLRLRGREVYSKGLVSHSISGLEDPQIREGRADPSAAKRRSQADAP